MQTLEKTGPRRFEWNFETFYKLEGTDVFGDARIELIEGDLIEMEDITPRHAVTTSKVNAALLGYFSHGYIVSAQNPVKLSSRSVAQPDIAGLRGTYTDYFETLPETAVLMIEVADSTLATDRRDKTSLYARYGIQEFWIVNVADSELEIYRQPRRDASAKYGFSYGFRQILGREEAVSPLEMPEFRFPSPICWFKTCHRNFAGYGARNSLSARGELLIFA
jgi:Uma2 family endonuclease